METLLPLIIQLIGGAAGGNGAGALLKNVNLSTGIKSLAGIIGGISGGQLASLVPALHALLGDGGAAMVAGNVGASAIGGGLLTLVVGVLKQALAKPNAA